MRPVSIPKIGPPNIHRLGAAKNRRAPARAGETTGDRERGRPRPHQPDDQAYDLFRSRKSGHRTFTGWVRRRIARAPACGGKSNGVGSAAVPGRIKPTTDSTNPIESLLSQVRDCEKNIKRYRNSSMSQRWLASVLLYAESKFRRIKGADQIKQVLINIDAIQHAPQCPVNYHAKSHSHFR